MGGTRARLALALLRGPGRGLVRGGGQRRTADADATFAAFPGPGEVTYGEQIAYKARVRERTASSMLTHVRFRQTVPVARAPTSATMRLATCLRAGRK